MKMYKKLLVGSLVFLFNGALFAADCPQIGNYSLSSHNANNTRCAYKSNATVKLRLQGQRVLPPNCPRFILTDPHFQFVSCNHSIQFNKCICTIVAH